MYFYKLINLLYYNKWTAKKKFKNEKKNLKIGERSNSDYFIINSDKIKTVIQKAKSNEQVKEKSLYN